MRKNLLDYDLQLFADEEVTGVNEVEEAAVPEEEETSEAEESEGENESETAEPTQSAEENAAFAAIRRRERENARRELENERRKDAEMMNSYNQRIAAMCNATGAVHPLTGAPITNFAEYIEALEIQHRQADEQELRSKNVDPRMIDRMVANSPTVIKAQQYMREIEDQRQTAQLINDIEEIGKLDPNVKSAEDLYNAPYREEIIEYSKMHQVSLADAFKLTQFENLLATKGDASRQQAINQMKGKSHLPSASQAVVADNDDVEVPADIMASWKAAGKKEKEVKELYKTVAKKLHLN